MNAVQLKHLKIKKNKTSLFIPQVYSELLRDLKKFVRSRVGETVQLKIPTLYHSYEDGSTDSHVLVIEDLAKYVEKFPPKCALCGLSPIFKFCLQRVIFSSVSRYFRIGA